MYKYKRLKKVFSQGLRHCIKPFNECLLIERMKAEHERFVLIKL